MVALQVSENIAASCATFLDENWKDGKLRMRNGRTCYGYASYGKTLSSHDANQQKLNTLLITNALLPSVRRHVDGFEAIEHELASWLQMKYQTVVELFYAHGLRQSPATLTSTGFAVHQDTEDYDDIEYTIVVKLTPDEAGEAPSAMRVVGAEQHFYYCLLYTSPSPRDKRQSRMPSSA